MSANDLRLLPDLVRWAVGEYGTAVALEHTSTSAVLTFKDLSVHMSAGSARMQAAGLKPREPVLLVLEPGPEWAVALFAIVDAGLVAVPLATETPSAAIAGVTVRTGCRVAVCSARTESLLAQAASIERICIEQLLAGGRREPGAAAAHANEVALLVFTSGSTRQPRAVELTHANLLSNLNALLQIRHERPGKAMLSMLPPAHMFEMMAGLLAPLARGARVVYAGSLLPNRLVDALREHRITHALAVPALVEALYRELLGQLAQAGLVLPERETQTPEQIARLRRDWTADQIQRLRDDIRQRIGDSFETLAVGGAGIDPALAELIGAAGIHVEVGYGLTEASPVVAVGLVGECPPGSVGRPLPGVEVRIDEGGEILVRGPNVMRGYYKDPAATAAVLQDGWLRTGDCGRLDRDGFLFVTGRLKEAIVTAAGRTVYPEEIEPYYRHPLFAELCAAGVRGEHGNDVPVLFVVATSPEISDAELLEAFGQLRANAPPAFRLERLMRLQTPMPRTAAGKIRRRLLAASTPAG